MFRVNPQFLNLFLLFFIFTASAQETKKNVPLKSILTELSAVHHLRFSYLEDEISNVVVAIPDINLSYALVIADLERQTGLHFRLISGTYIIFDDNRNKTRICGYIVGESGNPIADAIVKSGSLTAISGANGYFELGKTADSIFFSHIGYDPKRIHTASLSKSDCLTLKLSAASIPLQEVAAQRFLATGIAKNNDGTVEVTPAKFGVLPGLTEADVLQAMQQLPGIYSTDETVSNISIRGGTHGENMFLWNGIRMFQTGHFFGLISAFDTSLPQSVSIVKNGTSANFGESVSGLINISSSSRNIGANRFTVSSNMISAQAFARVKLSSKSSIEMSGRRSLTDIFNSPTYRQYSDRIFQNTEVTNLSTNENINYTSSKNFYFYDFTVHFRQKIGTRHELLIDGIGIQNSLDVNRSSIEESNVGRLDQQNFGGALYWKSRISKKTDINVKGFGSKYTLSSSNESVGSSQALYQRNIVLATGFRVRADHHFTPNLSLSGAWHYDETGVNNFDEVNIPLFSRDVTQILRTSTFIAESIMQWPDSGTRLSAGVRINDYRSLNITIPEARIQLSQILLKTLRLEVLSEQKSQTISQVIDFQQDFLGIEKRRWALADGINIPVLKSSQVSAELIYTSNQWLATFCGFYKEVSGITAASQGFQNQYELSRENGNYKVKGIEALIQKNFGRFYTWLSYTYNYNVYSFPTLQAERFPNNFELRHIVSYAGIYEWKRLKLALGGTWHTGRPETQPAIFTVPVAGANAQEISYTQANSSRLPDFVQINFSALHSWKIGADSSFEAGFSLLNLLNKKNVVNRFYRVGTDDSVQRINIYGLRATPNVNVKVVF